MNAKIAFLCLMTSSLSITIPIPSRVTAASASDAASAPHEIQEAGKPATPRKGDPNVTARGTPSAGKPKQIPGSPNPSQVVEERLRSGQMEKPIAQGEISERLNRLYSGSNSGTGETAAEHSSR
jgi:hypothetical protein